MSGQPAFWRFLPDEPPPDVAAVRASARVGKGALARTLREARGVFGAPRAAALLKWAVGDGLPSGLSLKLLVAAPFQPRAIEDALHLSFAIAGIAVDIRAVDGLATLARTLDAADPAPFAGVDMALIPLLGTDAGVAAGLAGMLADRCSAPVLLASAGQELDPPLNGHAGVEAAPIRMDGPVVDERFGGTFGAVPSEEAADRIADAAAARAARIAGTAPKLLVTDLDGVLWKGTLGEDGVSGVALHESYARVLRSLADDGLILALASRNDPHDVDAAFATRPVWPLSRDAFAAASVGWEDKGALAAAVLAEIGLGSEHMIFVDDDPVNCAAVATRFPEADVRFLAGDPDAFAASLRDDPLLRQSGSADGDRTAQYQRRAGVERLRETSADVGDFLRRLRTVVTVVPLAPSLFPRAVELASRVNQFTLVDARPNFGDVARRRSPLDFMLRLDDAFGAHGLVALVLAKVEAKAAKVENLFMSCRALGRGVEASMLAALGRLARDAGCDRISGTIDVLPRNEPARKCFSQYLDTAGGSSWTIRLDGETAALEGTTLRWATTTT